MTLIHPDLAAALTTSGHFPSTGTVQVKTIALGVRDRLHLREVLH